jgi:hypothetical protein
MPFWIATILGGLVQIAGHLVGRVLISLGLGYVTFTGVGEGFRDVAPDGRAGRGLVSHGAHEGGFDHLHVGFGLWGAAAA